MNQEAVERERRIQSLGNVRDPDRRDRRPERRPERRPDRRPQPTRPKVVDQRVAIAIDVSNLYYGAKSLYNTKVAYEKFMARALNNRKLVRSIAYIANRDSNNQGSFVKLLKGIGCDVRSKQVIEHSNGGMKCNWDVEIAIDAVALAPRIDTFVLASGDGDFTYLLKTLRTLGVRTEVIAFRPNTSHMLIEEADEYHDITRDMLIETSNAWRRRDERPERPEQPEPEPEVKEPASDKSEPASDKSEFVCPKCERKMKSSSGYTLHVKKCCPDLVKL